MKKISTIAARQTRNFGSALLSISTALLTVASSTQPEFSR